VLSRRQIRRSSLDSTTAILLVFFVVFPIFLVPHEYGHMVLSLRNGIKVKSFNLGAPMPVLVYRPVASRAKYKWCPLGIYWWMWRHEVQNFSLGFSPYFIGGYVDIDRKSFESAPLRAKILGLVGGPLGNLITSTALVTVVVYSYVLTHAVITGTFVELVWRTCLFFVIIPVGFFVAGFIGMLIIWFPPTFLLVLCLGGFLLVKSPIGASAISVVGPLGSVQLVSKTLSDNLEFHKVLIIIALYTFFMGFINSMPIPGLDGGYIWLAILGHRFKRNDNWENIEKKSSHLGLWLILGLLIVGLWMDITSYTLPLLVALISPTIGYYLWVIVKKLGASRHKFRNKAESSKIVNLMD